MATTPSVELSNGAEMPILGYGTWQAEEAELEAVLEVAFEEGYRHIDTAAVYGNEKVIGRVLKNWFSLGIFERQDVFIVTKLPPTGMRPEAVPKYLKQSLENLQLDYVDMYLVHLPFGFQDGHGNFFPMQDGRIMLDMATDHLAIWKAMEEQVDAGLTKAIGLSNFNIPQITRILKNCRIRPSNLQVELHIYHQQNELVAFCKTNHIVVTAYSPLANPGLQTFYNKFGQMVETPNVFDNPVIKEIAARYNKTSAQIVLRHIVQRDIVAIPKSVKPERVRQNIDIFNFRLNEKDMETLNGLDRGARILDFKIFDGANEHPEYPF